MEGYCLYEHVFPDGKKYIGISKNPHRRWKADGSGYISNRPMWKAIQKYGWDKIQHNILASGLSCKEAKNRETEEIEKADSIHNGYNQKAVGTISHTFYNGHVMKMIRDMKKNYWLIKDFLPTAERLLELGHDEVYACEINYFDAMLRHETDGYTHGISYCTGSSEYEAVDWYYYLRHYTLHPEIDFRKIEGPWEYRQKVLSEAVRKYYPEQEDDEE